MACVHLLKLVQVTGREFLLDRRVVCRHWDTGDGNVEQRVGVHV
ncbi:hypothetical protein PC116_g4391 [Phytophthora cactorum]|nr:hypothetical protein PC114_g21725 [Phytophthora cactorum]KAG4247880.1 hypothetical protein PC116_g4391 [Phytophthora cactorum]